MCKARRAMYRLRGAGVGYPGLSSEAKAHIWKTVGVPSLLYGCDSVSLTKKDLNNLQSTQGSIVKSLMGLGIRAHHTALLTALEMSPVSRIIL